MGRVFRARDGLQKVPVAIKVFLGRGDAHGAARFARECSLLARIAHPGIVRYIEHGSAPDGTPWLAMEWLEGRDLAALLSLRREQSPASTVETGVDGAPGDSTLAGPITEVSARSSVIEVQHVLSLSEVLALLRRVVAALAVLHGEGILHRDLKPGNLFLADSNPALVRMIDLGTARATSSLGDLTGAGTLVGTPFYMAPEQARAEGILGTAVDVWALGCIAYECLVGRPPFTGSHVLGILARILVEEPTPVRHLRPEIPDTFASLLSRMLDKEAALRPTCQEILQALDRIQVEGPGESSATLSSIGETERRVRCVLLARAPGFAGASGALREATERAAARIDCLAEGTLLVTLSSRSAPGDQALKLVRVAMALQRDHKGASAAIATGQTEGGMHLGVGELSVRAATMLAGARPGELLLDAPTSTLLEGRFQVTPGERGHLLVGEHRVEQARTLLGRPTPTVGRRRELGLLLTTWQDCLREPRSRPVLVTAGPGVGKSRLRSELLRVIAGQDEPFTALLGQGDSLRAGSPFVVIAPAIRRRVGLSEGDPPAAAHRRLREHLAGLLEGEALARVAGFLGELIGAPAEEEQATDALRAARQDPMLFSEQMALAFVEWLGAEARRSPVLFVVEDLHWGDRPSLRLLEAALRGLPDAPLMIVVFARPEIHEVFPALWAGYLQDEIRLEPLNRKASAELAREVLGESAPAGRIDAIVERAGGNALYLEELIRAVAEGSDAVLPDTVIGMVQVRLDALGPDARRLLKAASVFGEAFPEQGVRALAGAGGSGYDVGEWLHDLCRRELLSELPPEAPGAPRRFRFRHALVRDGAYATLTREDQASAHRLACVWLEASGERDALTMASHAELGGDIPRALRWLRRAAEQALESNDLPGVIAAGERALAHGPAGEERGAVLALLAVAAYWQSRYRSGADWGLEAASLLPASSSLWFLAVGSTLVSLARLSEFDRFDPLFELLRGAQAAPGAEAAQLVALCRGTFQLIFKGRFAEADATLELIARLTEAAGDLDALTLAQVNHVRGVRFAMVGDVGAFFVNLERAVDCFERAGDLRNVSLEGSTVGWCYVEVGQVEHAVRLLRASLARCLELRSQQAITYAKANLGHALARLPGHHEEAQRILGEAIAETRAVENRRLEGWARGYLNPTLRASLDPAREEQEARLACELLSSAPGLLAWTLAQRARALLSLDRPGEALPLAREAMTLLERQGGLLQGESLPPLVLVECLQRTGAHDAARDAARDAIDRLRRRADRLPRADWRASFLAIEENRQTLALLDP